MPGIRYILTTLFILFTVAVAGAGSLEKHQIIKISAQDRTAVIKTPQGEMQIITVGDRIGNAVVTEIVEGRVVLTRGKEHNTATVILRLVDGKQTVEIHRARGEKRPLMTKVPNAKTNRTRMNTERAD